MVGRTQDSNGLKLYMIRYKDVKTNPKPLCIITIIISSLRFQPPTA